MSVKRYPLRRPKFAYGIRSQETRSASGRSVWAKKWFAALVKMDLGGRFGRGRNYAMSGQVTELVVAKNLVRAEVQGQRSGRYTVTVDFRIPPPVARKRIIAALRHEPMLVARLLAGELPMEVEEIFRNEGFSLYPGTKLLNPSTSQPHNASTRLYDVVTSCSCPDYANPCKHVFAVLTVLGEEIASRPARLLELRGISMEELI